MRTRRVRCADRGRRLGIGPGQSGPSGLGIGPHSGPLGWGSVRTADPTGWGYGPHSGPYRLKRDRSAQRTLQARHRASSGWLGSKRPRLTPHSGSSSDGGDASINLMPGKIPPESCQPPRIRPAIHPESPGPTTTFDSSGPSGPVRFVTCPGCPHHERDQRSQQVGRDRQPRPLGNIVDLADNFQPVPRPDNRRQRHRQAGVLVPSSEGDQSRRDHAAFTSPR